MNISALIQQGRAIASSVVLPSNSTLMLKVITGTSTNASGNPTISTEPLAYSALVHDLKKDDQYFEGADRKLLNVKGRLVSPKVFDTRVKHLTQGEITLDGRQGKFTLYLLPQSAYLNHQLGDYFEGLVEWK